MAGWVVEWWWPSKMVPTRKPLRLLFWRRRFGMPRNAMPVPPAPKQCPLYRISGSSTYPRRYHWLFWIPPLTSVGIPYLPTHLYNYLPHAFLTFYCKVGRRCEQLPPHFLVLCVCIPFSPILHYLSKSFSVVFHLVFGINPCPLRPNQYT